jgi:hypothetical protein
MNNHVSNRSFMLPLKWKEIIKHIINLVLILKARSPNSILNVESLYITFSTKGVQLDFSVDFKLIDMTKYNASLYNKRPQDWFMTQVDKRTKRKSTIIFNFHVIT